MVLDRITDITKVGYQQTGTTFYKDYCLYTTQFTDGKYYEQVVSADVQENTNYTTTTTSSVLRSVNYGTVKTTWQISTEQKIENDSTRYDSYTAVQYTLCGTDTIESTLRYVGRSNTAVLVSDTSAPEIDRYIPVWGTGSAYTTDLEIFNNKGTGQFVQTYSTRYTTAQKANDICSKSGYQSCYVTAANKTLSMQINDITNTSVSNITTRFLKEWTETYTTTKGLTGNLTTAYSTTYSEKSADSSRVYTIQSWFNSRESTMPSVTYTTNTYPTYVDGHVHTSRPMISISYGYLGSSKVEFGTASKYQAANHGNLKGYLSVVNNLNSSIRIQLESTDYHHRNQAFWYYYYNSYQYYTIPPFTEKSVGFFTGASTIDDMNGQRVITSSEDRANRKNFEGSEGITNINNSGWEKMAISKATFDSDGNPVWEAIDSISYRPFQTFYSKSDEVWGNEFPPEKHRVYTYTYSNGTQTWPNVTTFYKSEGEYSYTGYATTSYAVSYETPATYTLNNTNIYEG